MSETQHTPGPWEPDGMGNMQHCVAICAGKRPEGPESQREHMICEVYGDANDPNTRLIAAAPDMLRLLKQMARAFKIRGHCGFSKEAANINAFISRFQ